MTETIEIAGVTFTGVLAPTSLSNQESHMKCQWSHAGVLLLIETFKEHMPLLKIKRSTEVWRMVAQDMAAKGHSFTPEQCQKKLDNLKSRYKIIKERALQTGRGRDSWYYYDLIEDLLGHNSTETLPVAVSSLCGQRNGSPECSSEASTSPRMTVGHFETVAEEASDRPTPSTPLMKRPYRKRQRDRNGDRPDWFKDYLGRQERLLTRLVDAVEKKNTLLGKMLQKL